MQQCNKCERERDHHRRRFYLRAKPEAIMSRLYNLAHYATRNPYALANLRCRRVILMLKGRAFSATDTAAG